VTTIGNEVRPSQLRLHRTVTRDLVVHLSVTGELDRAVVGAFRDAVMTTLYRRRISGLVIDLGSLNFMDFSGANVLTDARHEADHLGIEFRVVNVNGPAQLILEAFDVHEAVTSSSSGGGPSYTIPSPPSRSARGTGRRRDCRSGGPGHALHRRKPQ
jgi:anti-anti-sigma factor